MGNVNADLRCVCGDALVELTGGSLYCEECIRQYVRIDSVYISGDNPRKYFNDDALHEMCSSIREHGIVEPLIFRRCGGERVGMFELVAGERRYRSAGLVELKVVPADIRNLTDNEVSDIMLIENMQRVDLQPLEEADAIRQRLAQGDITQEQLAKKLGKSQSWVANRLRLLQAPDKLIDMLISREMTPRHVMALMHVRDYPLIIDKVLKRYDVGGSVVSLESDLDSVIRWERDCTINIDDPGWDYRNDDIDIIGCAECGDILDKSEGLLIRRYCLNVECWNDMVRKVRDVKTQADGIEFGGDVVDIGELDHESWSWLPGDNPDEAECDACDHQKFTSGGSKICLNAVCAEGRRETRNQARKVADENEVKCVDAAIIKWTSGKAVLLNDDLRMVMRSFMDQMYSDDVDKALAPWFECDEGYDCEIADEFINSVPDHKIGVALMRLVIFTGLPSYHPCETFKDKFPDAAKFLDQTSLDDLVSSEVPA